MASTIFNPAREFETTFKGLHHNNTTSYFEELVRLSGVNANKNRETIAKWNELKENSAQFKKKYNLYRFLRVLACITLVLIPLVIKKLTPTIQELRANIQNTDDAVQQLLSQAYEQMQPLNNLFTDRDCLNLVQKTLPQLSFADYFSVNQQEDMRVNYDFDDFGTAEDSTLDVLAGKLNENPFVFEKRFVHTMGTETYHGSKTIYWTETYVDGEGEVHERTESETLHASVTKPKPFYSTQVVLNFCAQAAPNLYFNRDAAHVEKKNERQLERHIKHGERALQKKAEQAVKQSSEFTPMSNTRFEVLFNALNRVNEVEFRALFTPLAQTNLVELLLSDVGYGDDFGFVKSKRTNKIFSEHSQNRQLFVPAHSYISYSFDEIKESFINKNTDFFKAVYFDFAPLLAIPDYQSRPVHSLKPIPDYSAKYSVKECEAMANILSASVVTHPDTKTPAILKSTYVGTHGDVDETCITAYSYDIVKRTEYVSKYGGDGFYHDVPVEWDDYIPLVANNKFHIASENVMAGKNVIARRNGLCIF